MFGASSVLVALFWSRWVGLALAFCCLVCFGRVGACGFLVCLFCSRSVGAFAFGPSYAIYGGFRFTGKNIIWIMEIHTNPNCASTWHTMQMLVLTGSIGSQRIALRPFDQFGFFRHQFAEALHPSHSEFGTFGRIKWISPVTGPKLLIVRFHQLLDLHPGKFIQIKFNLLAAEGDALG